MLGWDKMTERLKGKIALTVYAVIFIILVTLFIWRPTFSLGIDKTVTALLFGDEYEETFELEIKINGSRKFIIFGESWFEGEFTVEGLNFAGREAVANFGINNKLSEIRFNNYIVGHIISNFSMNSFVLSFPLRDAETGEAYNFQWVTGLPYPFDQARRDDADFIICYPVKTRAEALGLWKSEIH
jgi:hypothetical protein